ncbi:putative receptor-like protein kinase [Carex littledalei]|uniref:Putative receptor-like protein kinase n=1 Tax=Carex littledalei TaxID=544730 RepID=A0A833VRX8_9POAL|nr:putative receptor-like protein kinase [Carex littledalei]
MAMLPILLFLLILLQSHIQITICKKHDTHFFDICPSSRCSDSGPEIRFPYRLDKSPKSCGVHGMELTCSPDKDTILTLPNLGTAIVQTINYQYGYVTVKLGNSWPSCLLTNQTMMNVTTLLYSPVIETVSIITCPKMFTLNVGSLLTGPVSCLSSSGKYVYVVSADESMDKIPSSCMVLQTGINILLGSYVDENSDRSTTWKVTVDDFLVRRLVTLNWFQTNITKNCLGCEKRRRQCGYDLARTEAFCKPHVVNVKAISAVSSVVFVLILTIPATLFYLSRKADKERETRIRIERFLATYRITKPTRYTFKEVKKITKHFKDKLGQGGFGSVYKGELRSGLPVAIKMLEGSKGAGEDFINEVATIGRIHHVNIVRLVGFCSEGTRRALVYEFMPNDSLEKYIILRKNGQPLKMEKLLQISIGIARGIEYLHQGCNERILHFDIKPRNILLDQNLNPKIADFGLAKLCSKDISAITMTAARGTMGYIAPEVFSRNFGTVSYKSDVYSFGMLLLELIGGTKSQDPDLQNHSDVYFPELVYNRLVLGEELELGMQITTGEAEIARKLIIVAFWCIQWNPIDRPSMTRVVNMLIGELQNLEMPPMPFVSTRGLVISSISEEE